MAAVVEAKCEGLKLQKVKNEKKEKKEKNICLSEMFPNSLVLLTSEVFKGRDIPYKISKSYLEKSDKKLIWISTDQPADKIPEIFREYGIDVKEHLSRILFVDLVSKGAGTSISKESGCNIHYVENPNNMVEITMLFADLFNNHEVELAVIDSINGLLAFNSTSSVIKLLRFLNVIAYRTETTVLVDYFSGQYGKDIDNALQIIAEVSMFSDEKEISIVTRTGTEKLKI